VHLSPIVAIQPDMLALLLQGCPSTQERDHLRLLPSGPDRVHGRPLRRTLLSTQRQTRRNLRDKTSNRNSTSL